MESNAAVTPSKSASKSKSKLPENVNPNVTSPNLKPSKSNSPAALKSPIRNKIYAPSPKNKIRERKFVVAKKKNSNKDKNKAQVSVNCKCKAGADSTRCVCVAYETLRASQEGFFKSQIESSVQEEEVIGNPSSPVIETETSGEKRKKIPEPGSGRVMHLVKAFENILTLPKTDDEEDEKEKEEVGDGEKRDSKWELSSDSFGANELLLTAENLGLCSRVSSSLDTNRGSFGKRTTNGGRQSRRNSSESASTFGGGRWRRRINRATSQQPFKLRTEQRGKSKQEEFMKKVQVMMIEEEKQRIPIAQGIPFTTDEPECLVKPPVKEITRPIDLVLHSDVRAVERAEFDHQVQEKLSYIEQYKMERERLQKLEEEEELRRLRKELVPKAQPMPYFDRPFIPRRSEKQPTIPKEPKFHNHPQHKKIKCCSSMSSWSDMCAQAQ